jgi:hypothetical protein
MPDCAARNSLLCCACTTPMCSRQCLHCVGSWCLTPLLLLQISTRGFASDQGTHTEMIPLLDLANHENLW